MTRIINAFEQFFTVGQAVPFVDQNGTEILVQGAVPLVSGQIDFFESGSSTVRKTTFSNEAQTVANSNPLIIGSDGRVPDVFGDGTYRIVVKDAQGNQILARDPVGGDTTLNFGADWSSTVIYSQGDVVRFGDTYYISLVNNNLNKNPSTDDGSNWQPIDFSRPFGSDWLPTVTYGLKDVVFDDGEYYISLVASNLNNDPSTDGGVNWALLDFQNTDIIADIDALDVRVTALEAQVAALPTNVLSTSDLIHVQDQKTSGTEGGTFNSGSYLNRTLNTVVRNTITGASLASNRITLPAGDYYAEFRAPANQVNRHKAKIENQDTGLDILIGQSGLASNANASSVYYAEVSGFFTLAAENEIKFTHRCESTKATDGYGRATSFGDVEIYSDVKVWKVG